MKHTFFYEGGGGQKHGIDYITKTWYASRLSHRVLHDLCMCMEATRVGQMIFALRKARATIYEIKTDSCLYRPTRRSDKLFLSNLRYKDMAKIWDLWEKPTQGERRLNDRFTLPDYPSEDPVYRANPAEEQDPMKTEPSCPRRNATLQCVPPSGAWELTKEEATRRVLHSESLAVHGIAGVGKSTFVKGLVEELKASGKKPT